MKIYILIIGFFLLATIETQAQFEKKITFDLGVGYAIPNGQALREDNVPYFYSNLLGGLSFMGQMQYNLSEKFAIGLKVEYSGFSNWYDPRTESTNYDDSYMTVVNPSAIARYRLLSGKFSPYFIGGVGAGFYYGERSSTSTLVNDFYPAGPDVFYVSIDQVLFREPGVLIETDVQLSAFGGLGLEYDISQSLGIFVLGSYQYINSQNNTSLRQNILYLSFTGGVKLNFVKSKTF